MEMNEPRAVVRGSVYWVNLDPTIGSEVHKTRPGVILSNDQQNKVGHRFIIAPVTSAIGKIYPFEAIITLKNGKSKVMCDQIRTIDKKRLAGYMGLLTQPEIADIERALKLVLDLD